MVDYFENSLLISNLGVRRNLGTLSAFAQLIVRNLIYAHGTPQEIAIH